MRRAAPRSAAIRRGEPLRVVVDANVVAAALVRPGGWTARELARADVEWVAPAFLFVELADHADEYAAKAGCTRKEWRNRVAALARRFHVLADDDLADAAGDLLDRIERVDPDDVPYAAALLVSGADLLWTRDAALRAALPGLAVSAVPTA